MKMKKMTILEDTGSKAESKERHKKNEVTQNLLKSKISQLRYSSVNKTKNKSIHFYIKARFKKQIMRQMFCGF